MADSVSVKNLGGRPRESDDRLKARKGAALRKPHRAKKKPKAKAVKRLPFRLGVKTLTKYCRTLVPGYDPWRDANGYRFDAAAGRAAVRFFHDTLTHVKGAKARKPFALEPWEVALVANIYGWKDSDGSRRYREVLVYIPRKNGKTPLAAGMILLSLFHDGEPGAEIYGAADKYARACHVFAHARGMVRNCPELDERCQIFKGQAKAIQLNDDKRNVDDLSVYLPISAETTEGHGQNTHVAVVDELHLQPDRELVDSLRTATASEDRRQPLIVYLTTADYMHPSICNEIYTYACQVRDGIVKEPAFLPMIYEASGKDDWTDEAVWERVNPNLDVSVSRDYLRRECKRAIDAPAHENVFKRLHLNIRTEQDVRWLPMEKWDACGEADVDPEALKGRKCWGGLDLAATSDTTALALLFPDGDGGFDLLMWFWLPKATARERTRKDRVPYEQWIREGLIVGTDGDVTDYAVIRRDLNALAEEYEIQELAIDRLFQGAQLATELQQDGLEVISFGQGFLSMTAPAVRFDELVREGKLHHGNNPVLWWMASNVSVELDAAGNIKPSRKKSTEKIDAIVAAIMALGRAMLRDDKPKPQPSMMVLR